MATTAACFAQVRANNQGGGGSAGVATLGGLGGLAAGKEAVAAGGATVGGTAILVGGVLMMVPSELGSDDMGLTTAATTDFVPKDGQLVYRAWGGGSREFGASWTPLDPRLAPDAYRNLAGLPDVNTGTFLTVGKIRNASGFTVIPGNPLGGNEGGWPEYIVPNASGQIESLQRYTVDPPF